MNAFARLLDIVAVALRTAFLLGFPLEPEGTGRPAPPTAV